MYPQPFAARRQRNVLDLGGDDELAGLDSRNQLADVDVHVALCLNAGRVVGDSPLIVKKRFRLCNRRTPQFSALLVIQEFERSRMNPGQRQPAARFGGIRVLEKKHLNGGGLFLSLAAKTATTRLHSLPPRRIGSAVDQVGVQSRRS